MEHVSSVRPTGKFPGKLENLKKWAHFPGWNFQRNFMLHLHVSRSLYQFQGPRQENLSGTATYRGSRPNGTTFYQSEIPRWLPPKFPGFFFSKMESAVGVMLRVR